FCIIRLRRSHLLQDALDELCRQRKSDLFKPLKVVFIGEEGVDEGGLKKEFFALIVQQLFDPSFGMFLQQEETRVLWFNPSSLESSQEFMLVGLLLGLAVYNHVLLDLQLPLVLWKKLLSLPLNHQDVADLSPETSRGLLALLEYSGPGDVQDVFCLTFQAAIESFGERRVVELKEGGGDVEVTNSNRREYVQRYVEYLLSSSVSSQFEPFKEGFLFMFEQEGILKLLSPRELEVLVCGSPNLDFKGLEEAATYAGGYSASSQAVEWFWQIVREWDLEHKKLLLKFVTGSDKSPIGG
ncbi:hypothetical protein GUITHDRAFT_46418, partial [Guillardia theta CCMP2712]